MWHKGTQDKSATDDRDPETTKELLKNIREQFIRGATHSEHLQSGNADLEKH